MFAKVKYAVVLAIAFCCLINSAGAANKADYCQDGFIEDAGDRKFCWERYPDVDPWEKLESVTAYQQGDGEWVQGSLSPVYINYSSLVEKQRAAIDAVGRVALLWQSKTDPEDQYTNWCSASVVSESYILTAWHCIVDRRDEYFVAAAHLRMNYLRRDRGEITRTYKIRRPAAGCAGDVPDDAICAVEGESKAEGGLDYAILEIEPNERTGNPASVDFSKVSIAADAEYSSLPYVLVPQHPMADAKHESLGSVRRDAYASNAGTRFGHNATTQPMSSGAPVLDMSSFKVVGLHVRGADSGGGYYERSNKAVKISNILEKSPILRNIVSQYSEHALESSAGAKEAGDILRVSLTSDTANIARHWTSLDTLLADANAGNTYARWVIGRKYLTDPSTNLRFGIYPVAGEEQFFSSCGHDRTDASEAQCYQNAVHWFNKALERGSDVPGGPEALNDIGELYFYNKHPDFPCAGDRRTPCYREAFRQFQQSASYEYAHAEAWLGALYIRDYHTCRKKSSERQCRVHLEDSVRYFIAAFEKDELFHSPLYIGAILATESIPQSVVPAEYRKTKVIDYYWMSAKMGNPNGMGALGAKIWCESQFDNDPYQEEIAKQWLNTAKEKGADWIITPVTWAIDYFPEFTAENLCGRS